jgi:two-component system sensor histidine kinase CpxA
LSGATQKISHGRFDTRVEENRSDELGDLAKAINVMAERLDAVLTGQRQFIADVAHEVASPVARMQIGLGILESRLAEADMSALTDVREDLEEMSGMLNELLLFSRARIEAPRSAPAAVKLRPLVDKVVHANSDGTKIEVDIPTALSVMAQPAMLSRALANLVRNAQRYGVAQSPPEIVAVQDANRVRLSVRDRGPGVPEPALARLGDPFFRPELSRSRATGGFGLGLAIVRRCIADCNGEVRFSNREGGGFEAELILHTAM